MSNETKSIKDGIVELISERSKGVADVVIWSKFGEHSPTTLLNLTRELVSEGRIERFCIGFNSYRYRLKREKSEKKGGQNEAL